MASRQSAFVSPETKKLHLKDNDWWVLVKKHLTIGEDRAMRSFGMGGMTVASGEGKRSEEESSREIPVNWSEFAVQQVVAYVTDWNLSTADGKTVPLTMDAINNLHVGIFEEISELVTKHIDEMKAGSEKNVKEASATSASKRSA